MEYIIKILDINTPGAPDQIIKLFGIGKKLGMGISENTIIKEYEFETFDSLAAMIESDYEGTVIRNISLDGKNVYEQKVINKI